MQSAAAMMRYSLPLLIASLVFLGCAAQVDTGDGMSDGDKLIGAPVERNTINILSGFYSSVVINDPSDPTTSPSLTDVVVNVANPDAPVNGDADSMARMWDGRDDTEHQLIGTNSSNWITFSFAEPKTLDKVRIRGGGRCWPTNVLGVAYATSTTLPGRPSPGAGSPWTQFSAETTSANREEWFQEDALVEGVRHVGISVDQGCGVFRKAANISEIEVYVRP